MKLARDIQSLSTFKRDTAKIMRSMKKSRAPVVLTVNGKAALVVQDAESYQELLDARERMETIEGIRRGLDSIKTKGGASAARFFSDFFSRNDIPEKP